MLIYHDKAAKHMKLSAIILEEEILKHSGRVTSNDIPLVTNIVHCDPAVRMLYVRHTVFTTAFLMLQQLEGRINSLFRLSILHTVCFQYIVHNNQGVTW